jgi:hypothetical protein
VKDRYSPEPLNSWTDMRAIARQEAMAVISSAGSLSSMSPGSIPFNATLRPFVTDLPVAATDGDEIRFLADGDAGVVWHLRYRAKAPSAYRWEFIGGPPLYAEVATSESTSSGTYVALATAGPTVTVPFNGDYLIEHGCRAAGTNAAGLMSYSIGSTAAADVDAAFYSIATEAAVMSIHRANRQTELVAQDDLVAQYRTSGVSVAFSERYMLLTPIRVGRP